KHVLKFLNLARKRGKRGQLLCKFFELVSYPPKFCFGGFRSARTPNVRHLDGIGCVFGVPEVRREPPVTLKVRNKSLDQVSIEIPVISGTDLRCDQIRIQQLSVMLTEYWIKERH